jgi:hypothetical protein
MTLLLLRWTSSNLYLTGVAMRVALILFGNVLLKIKYFFTFARNTIRGSVSTDAPDALLGQTGTPGDLPTPTAPLA